MASFQLLEPREEEELHKTRLLNVEEKPFKRVSKRLLAPYSFLTTPSKLPTPPPDSVQRDSASLESIQQKVNEERFQFKNEILLDFSAFDSSLIRIQFLRNSNEQERERYRADKARILATAQNVRDSNAQLRIHLDEARRTLEQRQKFDELAEKITGSRLLRPREDQLANLRKLEEECRELERESKNYKIIWAERREQFGRIVEEGMQLRRLIRDEKEEVERREGMAEEEDGENVDGSSSHDGQTPKHINGNGTPKHQNGRSNTPDRSGRPESRSGAARSTSRSASKSVNNTSPTATERRKREYFSQRDDSIMGDMTRTTSTMNETGAFESDVSRINRGKVEVEDKMDTS
ncbi:putative tho complex subunit 7 [Golovinomyces cichoracearum]|uniref:Putative tho complex subunit 7 n=1 Tax=Golovinomyces cichoracearum TaxID=62708 RepID=A0A420J598_9PEZI|nr:putative tho complex subunit 7 [Golovinomyces cichoracearum]